MLDKIKLTRLKKISVLGGDVFHGLKVIHDKREAVRYKYGKQLKFSIRPSYDLYASQTKLNFDIHF